VKENEKQGKTERKEGRKIDGRRRNKERRVERAKTEHVLVLTAVPTLHAERSGYEALKRHKQSWSGWDVSGVREAGY
jgi:hypothetical protein